MSEVTKEVAGRITEIMVYEIQLRSPKIKNFEARASKNLHSFVSDYALDYLRYTFFVQLYQRACGSDNDKLSTLEIVQILDRLTNETVRRFTLYPPHSSSIMSNLSDQCEAQAAAEIREIIENTINGLRVR